ncbi:extracellular matrix organizing protein FRAS1-like [Amphiura filiformis]|uniref:extracellular matrix organizing protein FRAS1-like n=1 Tax=Amphiura filiformis TaxID=82378 RepID=UPI003B20D85C
MPTFVVAAVFGFDKPVYYVKEDSSVMVNIVRLGCLNVKGNVVISTNDVTAFAGADYRSITNTLLPFEVQQTNHAFDVVTSSPDFRVEGEERFELCLSNPVQGVFGPHGLIRCATVVIEDCDTEIAFGDSTYTVNEGVGVVTVKVVRRGNLNTISSVDVVSSDVNAKAGATKDYDTVLHTVVFGAGETTAAFDITVNDDDVVEHLETFHLELQNINNSLIGEPRIAEVFIEDNDVSYSLDATEYHVSEPDGKVILTVTKAGNLDQETSIDIFTRDISTSSSEPNQDYVPLLEELSHNVIFAPGETSRTVTIDIVDDALYELPEKFAVILTSDIAAQLSAPSSAVVTINSDDVTCTDGYTGTCCEEGTHSVINLLY